MMNKLRNSTQLFTLKLERKDKYYQGILLQGNAYSGEVQDEIHLADNAQVLLKDTPYSLGMIIEKIIDYDQDFLEQVLDERGQYQLGHFLYDQAFGRFREAPQAQRELDIFIRILSEDEHICRLPWVLLAQGEKFLSNTGWSICIGREGELIDFELTPSPHILIVMPEPIHEPPTAANAHIEQLENTLSISNPFFRVGRRLTIVRTWENFQQQVQNKHFDVLYYYGHGLGNTYRSRLVFSTGKNHKRIDVPIVDFAGCFRHSPGGPPLLAYINCCFGDSGGLLGVGRQLGALIPAVITNRTLATIDAACAQAITFWRTVLLEGLAPHEAVRELYTRTGDLGLSLKDIRWMIPLLHCHYRHWYANPPRAPSRLERDPHWDLKLDRRVQFSLIAHDTQQMIKERKPRSLGYLWYGSEGQGIDLFHQRVEIELKEYNPDVFIDVRLPVWPDEVFNPHLSFSDMMKDVFEVSHLEDIPACIRTAHQRQIGRNALIYIRHQPIQLPGDIITASVLQKYIEWWDQVFTPLLTECNVFGLLGLSFCVEKPSLFFRALNKHLETQCLAFTVFTLLDEFKNVTKDDIRRFIDTHSIPIPIKRHEEVIESIFSKTKGHYGRTLEVLKEIELTAWSFSDNMNENDSIKEDIEGYE